VAAESAALKAAFEEHAKTSQERFGLEFEIGTQGMVWQYLNGHRPLNLSVALKFARGLGVSIERFSPRLAAELRTAGVAEVTKVAQNTSYVTTSRVPARYVARESDRPSFLRLEEGGTGGVNYPTKRSGAYAIRINTDALRPRIKPGEFVVVEPDAHCAPGDEVVVTLKNGDALVKVLHAERGGFVELLSINDDHRPLSIEVNEIASIHHVAGIAKEVLYESEPPTER
jgi:phage repressor protein C with HTH and peptisase S24 domain